MRLYQGVIEDINDPLMMGRARVRVFGLHTDDKSLIPTESLPWAQVITPTTSASMSGLGVSPTGLLNGSWVILSFLDSDNQYPIIIGSFHGLPIDSINQTATIEEVDILPPDASNALQKDASGKLIGINTDASKTPLDLADTVLTGARRASDFSSVSQDCIDLTIRSEGFSATAYLDTNNKWTIGYGTQTINGKAVIEGQTITKDQALEALKSDINSTRLPAVQRLVRVLVTQRMVDALVDFSFNIGIGAFAKSTLLSDLNAEKYLLAASRFSDWTKNGGGIIARRAAERALFLKDGIPTATGDLKPIEKADSAVNQTTTTDSAGNTTTTKTYNTNKITSIRGFTDPSGKYPLYYQEPDTHRLARNQNIGQTIVYKKEAARETGVPTANGGSWDQSPIPYNAKYPFNKVMASESGHLMEFDDTENSRRIHLYHSAGTFTEIDDNGTRVNRIVGDGYEIFERNGFVHVKGSLNVTVDGAHTLKVDNTLDIEVSGAATINIYNDATVNVSGNMSASIAGDTMIKSGGSISMDSPIINLNTGTANDLPSPGAKQSPVLPAFSELHVTTRSSESAMQYETPDEGDSSQYNVNRLHSGETTKDDITKTPEVMSTTSVDKTPEVAPLTNDCGGMHNLTEFPATLVLSKYFTIGDLNKNGSRKLISQLGLQPGDIACNMKLLCMNALDTVKSMFPNMIISSGFRRPGDAANSSKTSQHYAGQAVDIQLPGFSKEEYLNAVQQIKAAIPYDQLLLEYEGSSTTWIHISYSSNNNRSQIFTMFNHKRISDFGVLMLA